MIFEVKERFKLTPNFLAAYEGKQPEWGPLGYVSFKRTYARRLENGGTEEFWQTLKRVVEGCYTIQLNHCKRYNLPWNAHKAQHSAQDMFTRMWNFKLLPPGRGLWMMGTDYVYERGSVCLTNCAYVTSENIDKEHSYPFITLMDLSMMGVGVSFDTLGENKVKIVEPKISEETFIVEDSKEGWTLVVKIIIDAYFGVCSLPASFDYSLIRPEGAPIVSFGGIAPGPQPLINCVEELKLVLNKRVGKLIDSTTIVDLMNIIGKCIVSGNVRRSAELAMGRADDEEYLKLKDPSNPELLLWRFTSNNSVYATVGMDYETLTKQTAINGEPGFFWRENARTYGRMADGYNEDADPYVGNVNPCLTGDTLVAVADGRGAVSLEQLAKEGKDVPVYSITPEGKVEIKLGRNPRVTGENKEVLEITLDDNTVIKATPNHKFLLKSGLEIRADELSAGDSLQRFTKWSEPLVKGGQNYLRVNTNIYDRHVKEAEHRMVCKFFKNTEWYAKYDELKNSGWLKGGIVVHHKDYNPLNNSIDNLEIMSFEDHSKFHGDRDQSGENNGMWGKEHKESTKELIGAKSRERWQDPEYKEKMRRIIKLGMDNPETRRKISDAAKKRNFTETLNLLRKLKRAAQPVKVKTVIENEKILIVRPCETCNTEMSLPYGRRETSFCSISCANKKRESIEARREGQHRVFAEKALETKQKQLSVFKGLEDTLGRKPSKVEFEEACKERGVTYRFNAKTANPNIFSGYKELIDEAATYNHRVKSVRKLDSKHTVYNITVDDNHTVAYVLNYNEETGAANGIFTSNCGEIALEGKDGELCNLVETFPSKHESYEDYEKTCKVAYIYAKTVTLVPTHNQRINQVINRNRRIGISQSGVIESFQKHGRRGHFNWCDKAYKYLRKLDKEYSRNWLGVPTSIKITTIKPSGTVSLLPGVTPGVHYAHSEYYYRTIRVDKTSPLIKPLRKAGHRIEESVYGDNTLVVYFPVHEENFDRSKTEVSIWEQLENVAQLQNYWCDNQVSATVTFKPEEADQIHKALEMYETRLKGVSFLPLTDHQYAQAPYQEIDKAEYEKAVAKLKPLVLVGDTHEAEEKFCTTDACEIKQHGANSV